MGNWDEQTKHNLQFIKWKMRRICEKLRTPLFFYWQLALHANFVSTSTMQMLHSREITNVRVENLTVSLYLYPLSRSFTVNVYVSANKSIDDCYWHRFASSFDWIIIKLLSFAEKIHGRNFRFLFDFFRMALLHFENRNCSMCWGSMQGTAITWTENRKLCTRDTRALTSKPFFLFFLTFFTHFSLYYYY